MARENLKKARHDHGWTQQALADKLGISLRHYQQIELGVRIGHVTIWDTLEDLTGIHQRILRKTDFSQEDNLQGLPEYPQY